MVKLPRPPKLVAHPREWAGPLTTGWGRKALAISLGLAVLGAVKVNTYMQTLGALRVMGNLQELEVVFYNVVQRLKWQHFKSLELATRSAVHFDIFGGSFKQLQFSIADNLAWLGDHAPRMSCSDAVVEPVRALAEAYVLHAQANRDAIDHSRCSTWDTIDCSLPLPGVDSNPDVTVTLEETQAACDRLDSGYNVCEWMPGRPDVVADPQPPNLRNKCVCYACRGRLPTPDFESQMKEFAGTTRGTDAAYQCTNDPYYQSQGCAWDGGNCVPTSPKAQPEVLNSTEYMERFDTLLTDIGALAAVTEKNFLDNLSDLRARMMWAYWVPLVCLFVHALTTLLGSGVFLVRLRKHLSHRFWAATVSSFATGCMLFAMCTILASDTEGQLRTLMEVDIPMQSNAWTVLFQDAVLTTSASRFVMTAHGTGWVDEAYTGVPDGVRVYDYWFVKYVTNAPLLDDAIAKAKSFSQTKDDVRIFANIDKVNRLLVDLETISLTSLEPPDASARPANDTSLGVRTMYGETYRSAKAIYNSEIEAFLTTQSMKLVVSLTSIHAGGRITLILSLVIDALMVFINVLMFLVRTHELEAAFAREVAATLDQPSTALEAEPAKADRQSVGVRTESVTTRV